MAIGPVRLIRQATPGLGGLCSPAAMGCARRDAALPGNGRFSFDGVDYHGFLVRYSPSR
jgi:hypothetical protein